MVIVFPLWLIELIVVVVLCQVTASRSLGKPGSLAVARMKADELSHDLDSLRTDVAAVGHKPET